MTKHVMTGTDRTKIIEALKNNPNAAAVARQFGFGETTILTLCKKEGIELQHLLTEGKRTEIVELLKTNQNALATAKQIGVNHKTVLAVAKKERIDIKALRQAAKGRKTLPFTQWARGPGGKAVLQCAVYLNGGRRLCPSLNTSDTEMKGPQRMRLVLSHAIAEGQLQGGVKHPAWGLYGGQIPRSTKRLLTRLARLPWSEYELQRKEAALSLGLYVKTVDWLAKQDKARPESATAIRSRRARLRKGGQRFPKRDSWHFNPVGSMLAIHRDGPIYAQLMIAGSIFRSRLKARDRKEAAAILEPVRSARAQLRKAVEGWSACELGTSASVAAEAQVVTACGLFATALRAVGAPDEFIRLAMKPPAEIGKAVPQPVMNRRAERRAIKKAAVENCVQRYIELIQAHPNGAPEPREVLSRTMLNKFRVTVREDRDCRAQAIKHTGNSKWPHSGRPRRG